MSQSQTPPGNRPPSPKVFRPFTGGPPGQGAGSASPPPASPIGIRPVAARPYRPFAGQPVPANAEAAIPEAEAAPPPVVALTVQEPVAPQAPATLTPEYQTPVSPSPSPERESWEAYISGPSTPDAYTEPVVEHREEKHLQHIEAAYLQPVTEELPQIEVQEPTPVFNPAIERYGLPPRAAYQTPIFVAPTSEPPAESLIDEVDAAFITSGRPSGPESSASDEVLRAAANLEAIARKLRSGKVELRSVSESSLASDEATLATVLAALLATR